MLANPPGYTVTELPPAVSSFPTAGPDVAIGSR